MQGKENNVDKGKSRFLTSILISGIAHAAILWGTGVLSFSGFYTGQDARYLEFKVVSPEIGPENPQVSGESVNENNNEMENEEPKVNEKIAAEEVSENSPSKNEIEFSSAAIDTSSLSQIYKENSFNVSIKYPAGWTYLDQHLDSGLEGVIFWPSSADISPPPYIHLETTDKEYFYPAKFKKKFIYRDKEYYYNEPSEIGGEWQQSVYVRTGAHSDFIIKVIIKGKDNFNKFLPSFYAIVKSFDFNKNIL